MYNEFLADKISESLVNIDNVTEKKMFQGLCFLIDGKLCISVRNDEIMCRVLPAKATEELEKE